MGRERESEAPIFNFFGREKNVFSFFSRRYMARCCI